MAIQAPTFSKDLTFLCTWFCPFAQRTWLALNAKGIQYNYHEVGLKNDAGQWFQLIEKPKWFTELNPLGKVPVLAWQDGRGKPRSVYESNICNEYLEDAFQPPSHPPLFPADLVDRARCRMVIARFAEKFVPNFYRILIRQDDQSRRDCAQVLDEELHWLEEAADAEGPFFTGAQFGAVDCSLLPWFIRMPVLTHYREHYFGALPPDDCPRLARWYKAAMERPDVAGTCRAPEAGQSYMEELLHHYSKYADASAKSTSAHDFG